jgi:hypothetical protein
VCELRAPRIPKRGIIMRIVASLVAAAALMGVSSIAYAATAVGDITSINTAKLSLTLHKVASFVAPKSAHLSRF